MNISNRNKLPAAIIRALQRDPYDRGDADYSISDLVTPPRIVRLMRKHDHEITEDATERLWALLGQALHTVLERGAEAGHAEQRLFATINGRKLSGQIDLAEDWTLTDYKLTSAWSRVYGSRDASWEEQLNGYAWLARENGIEVRSLAICAFYRDWSARDAARGGKYPAVPMEVIPITMWSPEKAHLWVCNRLGDLLRETMPRCSKEDTWDGKRCEKYCAVEPFCDQRRPSLAWPAEEGP